MTPLKTIIVDDEPLALQVLSACLAEFPDIEVVAQCRNGREAIEATLRLQPDLMFLDIHMPGKNGFEVIKALQNDVMPMVVFVTTYQQYALDAFDLHAVDYIPKPLDEERLARAVGRALERFQSTQARGELKQPLIGAIDDLLQRLSDNADSAPSVNSAHSLSDAKLVVRDAGSARVIAQHTIDWVDAAGDYMCIHAEGETHIMRSTVKELVAALDERLFRRIHRSTIVNVERIASVQSLSKGDYLVLLECGEQLKVSRSYNEPIKQLLKKL
ncbi:LytR/AlgR family response regulator transcription factor [Gilvimarinus agarilyticus]|uniref:LytR/AlgR family response regulator transcription factor n=1 Tax=Gilvimarinus agarilyticus TaxID=679259 RepID=UPI0005A2A582|nr:LytTR family DNA-binding domain-containing protein [Gilvimarinus agarilyticus]